HADPVASNVSSGQDRGAIKRGIERGIRRQREEEEERGDAQQESDQLVKPPVARGDKDACQKTHLWAVVTRDAKQSCGANRPEPHHYLKNRTRQQWRISVAVYSWITMPDGTAAHVTIEQRGDLSLRYASCPWFSRSTERPSRC